MYMGTALSEKNYEIFLKNLVNQIGSLYPESGVGTNQYSISYYPRAYCIGSNVDIYTKQLEASPLKWKI